MWQIAAEGMRPVKNTADDFLNATESRLSDEEAVGVIPKYQKFCWDYGSVMIVGNQGRELPYKIR